MGINISGARQAHVTAPGGETGFNAKVRTLTQNGDVVTIDLENGGKITLTPNPEIPPEAAMVKIDGKTYGRIDLISVWYRLWTGPAPYIQIFELEDMAAAGGGFEIVAVFK